jgi:hypothetical protein
METDEQELPVTSSNEPEWPPEARDCYRDALKILIDAEIPFVVGGAFAIHRHTGIWRSTKDLDLLLVSDAVPAALHRLRERGFETHIEDPVWLAKAVRGDYFVDLITGAGNGGLIVTPTWIDRGIPDIVLGMPCRVMAAEELIASKLFVTRRERFDGADLTHLIRCRGRRIDWDYLLSLVGSDWQMLLWSLMLFAYVYPARTDVVPQTVWRDLLGRFEEAVAQPAKNAPFRGTLVDPKMFAIDVDEWGERDLYREYCEGHPCPLEEDSTGGTP